MRSHENIRIRRELSPRSVPLEEIWSVLTSEVRELLSQRASTATVPTSGAMITTTVTVDTTIVRTVTAFSPKKTSHKSTSLPSTTKHGQHTSLSAIVTKSPTTNTHSTRTLGTNESLTTPSATNNPTASHHNHHRTAIIGGLAGTIAGLVLIGILICFCLRRRRRKRDNHESINEKGLRPVLASKWSQLTAKKEPTAPPRAMSRSSTPDFDGGLIRVSLDNWPRPFAHGEGLRESMGPGQLRVTNPDPSRPTTPLPRGSSESIGGFLKQQKSTIAAVLLGANRSRQNSFASSPNKGVNIPAISVDPASSTEHVARNTPAPSFRSYPSVSTLPVVQSRPPEDPFLTPPDERDEMSAEARPRRPSANPVQTVAGAASRTLSHVGSALNPFRTKSNAAESVRSYSRRSVSTFSSAGDPFMLDCPSLHAHSGRTANDFERQPIPEWRVYEGT